MRLALAPMAGITDSAFRLMNKMGGADLVYSEMAHVNAISHNSPQTLNMLKASPYEFPYVVQLFGKDPKYFAQAAKILSTQGVPVMKYKPFTQEQLKLLIKSASKEFFQFQKTLPIKSGKNIIPSGIDINLGCPAKRVFGSGGGVALWKDLKNVRKIIQAVLENTDLPVSIKVRTAVGKVNLFELLDIIEDLPIKRVMVHGRSYAQGFSGPIDTATIKKAIKRYPQFEFWVNGGVVDSKSAQKIIKETGCSNLGIARGACGNPFLSKTIKDKKENKLPIEQQCALAYIHSVLAYQSKGARGIIEMRKHLAWYFKDFPGAKDVRRALVQVKNIDEIEKILSSLRLPYKQK